MKRVEGGRVVETLPRSQLVAVQTPQAFRRRAAGGARGRRRGGERLRLARRGRGGRVTVVPGDARLLKVTTPEDLALVESWLAAERS